MGLIIKGNQYGDPHKQAEKAEPASTGISVPMPHGGVASRDPRKHLVKKAMEKRGLNSYQQIPMGDTFPGGLSGSGSIVTTTPMYYDPRYSSPDKFFFPRTEVHANSVWEHLYIVDPVIAVATDIYADLPWSDFEITGVTDPRVKQIFQDSFSESRVTSWLPEITREFLKLGKAVPHLIFNEAKGYWIRIFCHNPSFLRVQGVPIVGEEPILDLIPTPELRKMVSSPDPRMQKYKELLPKGVYQRIVSGAPIPLSNSNVTYLSRRVSPYHVIGMSLYTRLFRIIMYEDFLVNASMAVAQRNAAPLRMFKLGDRETGWLPDKSDEEAFIQLLAAAETDPFAAIVTHYAIEVDYVGVSDKLMSVSREWEFIERVKFIGLGMSHSFLTGESSFAAAVAGLQTLADRLLALRQKIENDWLYPKFMIPLAKMNKMYHRTQAELDHRIRTSKNLIVPKLRWFKSLESTQDASLLSIWQDLHEKGICSDRTLSTGAGLNHDVERKNIQEEAKYKQEHPTPTTTASRLKRRASKIVNPDYRYHVSSDLLHLPIWDKTGRHNGVDYRDVEDVAEQLLHGPELTKQEKEEGKPYDFDVDAEWERVDEELQARGYSDKDIKTIRTILNQEGIIQDKTGVLGQKLEEVSKVVENGHKRHPDSGLRANELLSGIRNT